jgi:hypothetical protein
MERKVGCGFQRPAPSPVLVLVQKKKSCNLSAANGGKCNVISETKPKSRLHKVLKPVTVEPVLNVKPQLNNVPADSKNARNSRSELNSEMFFLNMV